MERPTSRKRPAAIFVLTGLILGLACGAAIGPSQRLVAVAQTIGGLWLDALRMTIIPLVFALIVTGIASGVAAGGTRVARRAIVLFVVLLSASALFGVSWGSILFGSWQPVDLSGSTSSAAAIPELPPIEQSLRALVPANPIAAAAQGTIVSIVFFALLFAVALRRIDTDRAQLINGFFQGVADTLLVIIGWVLLLAPLGVFALAFAVAAQSGLSVGAALAWYVVARVTGALILSVAFVAAVALFARTPLTRFIRAALPAQSVAFSTQSSLASLPAMIEAARALSLPERLAGTVLPLSVALFRISAPTAISLATLALARMNGIELGVAQLALVALLATLNNLVIAGLPNQISFFAAYAPVALAVGVPIELLPLLLAVDTVPDMFATTANVTADVAVTTLLTENETEQESETAGLSPG